MTNIPHAVRGGLLAALALLSLGSSAPAPAREAFSGNWLQLSVTRSDSLPQPLHSFDEGKSSIRETRGTLLLCDPPQGHVQAAQACAELSEADGDISRIPPKDVICTEIYAPARATARGEWNGRPVVYEQSFANGCVLEARTGAVFAMSN